MLSESELRDHGFPQPHPDSSLLGAAIINTRQKATVHKEIDEKVCCRCHKVSSSTLINLKLCCDSVRF